MALGVFFPFSKSRHRLAIPSNDAQPSTPFGCPAIQGAPRRHGGCPERVRVRSSEESKVRRSQERPREGQERSEPERNSQSWRCRGARWGIDIPILEAQGVDQTPIGCCERGKEVKQGEPSTTPNMQHPCGVLPREWCLKGLERVPDSPNRVAPGAEGRQDNIFANHGSMTSAVDGHATMPDATDSRIH